MAGDSWKRSQHEPGVAVRPIIALEAVESAPIGASTRRDVVSEHDAVDPADAAGAPSTGPDAAMGAAHGAAVLDVHPRAFPPLPPLPPLPEEPEDVAEPKRASPTDAVFRQRALEAYGRGQPVASVVRLAPPSTFAIVLCFAAALLGLSVWSFFGRIQVTDIGRGILRGDEPVRTVDAEIGGVVARVHVRAGDVVNAGDRIVTIDSRALEAQLLEAEERVRVAALELETMQGRDAPLYEEQVGLLHTEAQLARRQIDSQRGSLGGLGKKQASYRSLAERGYVPGMLSDEVTEQMRAVKRESLILEQQLARTQLQLASAELERRRELDRLVFENSAALAQRDAIRVLLEQTEIVAAARGRVERLEVVSGQYLTAGSPIARIVPLQAPTHAVAFLRERSRAFLQPGAAVRLEADRLPFAEFGRLRGVVRRISSDLASARELRDTLGADPIEDQACYRVEIELAADDENRALLERLTTGALVSARFSLRSQRIWEVAFAPLKGGLR